MAEPEQRRGLSTALAVLALFAAGTLLGVALQQPQALRGAWEQARQLGTDQVRRAGVPGDERWSSPPPGEPGTWHRVVIGQAPLAEALQSESEPGQPVEFAPAGARDAGAEFDAAPPTGGDFPGFEGLDGVRASEAFSEPDRAPATGDVPSAPPPVDSVVARPGATLWSIAAERYGAANGEPLIAALARYNQLASPDRLQAGQRVWLPPLEELLGP